MWVLADPKNGVQKTIGESEGAPYTPVNAPLGLKYTDHGLTEEELSKRHGQVGSLDLSKLNKGTRPDQKFSMEFLPYGAHDDAKAVAHTISGKDHWRNIFKDTSVEGLQHVFSIPEKGLESEMSGVTVYESDGHTHLDFDMYLKYKGEHAGNITRVVHRDHNGHIHVRNHTFEVLPEHQNKGWATELYDRAEQYWKHLSDGHPVHVSLDANISIGVYAWANKGFDFANADELEHAKDEFMSFCDDNGIKLSEALKNSGYKKLDDLKHSWQFSNLDDGNLYNAKEIAENYDHQYKEEIQDKPMPLGKAFMLAGKNSWNGYKQLNGSTIHEEIAEMYKRGRSKK